MRWLAAACMALAAAAAGIGCSRRAEPPPPTATADREASPAPTLPASEIKRGHDACQAYVDKVCGCADQLPALADECRLARALPDALQASVDVAAAAGSAHRDAVQSNAAARAVVKECIERTAKLPGASCP